MTKETTLRIALLLMAFTQGALAGVDPFRKFAEEVILYSNSHSNEVTCSRWIDSPSISCFHASTEEEKAYTEAITAINDALTPSRIQLRVNLPEDSNAQIKIYFEKRTKIPEVIRTYAMNATTQDYTWNFWAGPKSEVTKSIGIVCNENAAKMIQHDIVRTILGCLGLHGSTKSAARDSVFTARDATALCPTDKRLIAFYYEYVMPGFRRYEVRHALDTYWK